MTEEPDNGEHRPTDPQVHGSPDQQPGDGAGAADAAIARLIAKHNAAYDAEERARAGRQVSNFPAYLCVSTATISSQQEAAIEALYQAHLQAQQQPWYSPSLHGFAATSPIHAPGAMATQRPPLKDDGIQVGEITAWRVWKVVEGWLHSCAMDGFEWRPGQIVRAEEGRVDECRGIHAFKTRKDAIDYARVYAPAVVGEVQLWGQMIEFRAGWHAEYARPLDFHVYVEDGAMNPTGWLKRKIKFADVLDDLRRTYGINQRDVPKAKSQIPESFGGCA